MLGLFSNLGNHKTQSQEPVPFGEVVKHLQNLNSQKASCDFI
jgi:hypothetical protein